MRSFNTVCVASLAFLWAPLLQSARWDQEASRILLLVPLPAPPLPWPHSGQVVITGAGGVGFAYAENSWTVVMMSWSVMSWLLHTAAKALQEPPMEGLQTKCDVSDSFQVCRKTCRVCRRDRTVGYWINSKLWTAVAVLWWCPRSVKLSWSWSLDGNSSLYQGCRCWSHGSWVSTSGILRCQHGYCPTLLTIILVFLPRLLGNWSHFSNLRKWSQGELAPWIRVLWTTKRGLPQLTDSLVKGIRRRCSGYPRGNCWKIMVHNLSPGMVFTKLSTILELRKFPFGVFGSARRLLWPCSKRFCPSTPTAEA
jgi:hypothetical protein